MTGVAVPEDSVSRLLAAWAMWKAGHDRTTAEITCCGRSRELFAALDAFEEDIVPKLKALRGQAPAV